MENTYVSLNDLISAPVKGIKEADIMLGNGLLEQIAILSEAEEASMPVMRLKNVKFLYEKIKNDNCCDTRETMGITIPIASIIPLSALQIESSVIDMNAEVKIESENNVSSLKGKPASKHIRKTDFLPKMSIKIKTTKAELPEGTARLIDILDINQIPNVEQRLYIDSDGAEHKNQKPYADAKGAIEDIKRLNTITENIEKALSLSDNERTPVLREKLDKFEKMKRDKQAALLDAQIRILEDKIGDEQ